MLYLAKSHDDIQRIIQNDYATTIGRQIIDSYSIDTVEPTISIYDTPLLVGYNPKDGSPLSLRPDLLALINLGQGLHMSAIFEVKRTLNDLYKGGRQFAEYLGSTSCFFVAVPRELLGACICKIRNPKNLMAVKGIINADNGDIVVIPHRQSHSIQREVMMLCSVFSAPKYQTEVNGIYRPRDIPLSSIHCSYSEIDGMQVRNKYADVVLKERSNGYPENNYYRQAVGKKSSDL